MFSRAGSVVFALGCGAGVQGVEIETASRKIRSDASRLQLGTVPEFAGTESEPPMSGSGGAAQLTYTLSEKDFFNAQLANLAHTIVKVHFSGPAGGLSEGSQWGNIGLVGCEGATIISKTTSDTSPVVVVTMDLTEVAGGTECSLNFPSQAVEDAGEGNAELDYKFVCPHYCTSDKADLCPDAKPACRKRMSGHPQICVLPNAAYEGDAGFHTEFNAPCSKKRPVFVAGEDGAANSCHACEASYMASKTRYGAMNNPKSCPARFAVCHAEDPSKTDYSETERNLLGTCGSCRGSLDPKECFGEHDGEDDVCIHSGKGYECVPARTDCNKNYDNLMAPVTWTEARVDFKMCPELLPVCQEKTANLDGVDTRVFRCVAGTALTTKPPAAGTTPPTAPGSPTPAPPSSSPSPSPTPSTPAQAEPVEEEGSMGSLGSSSLDIPFRSAVATEMN